MNTPTLGPSCWPLLRSTLDLLVMGTTNTTHLSHTSLGDLTHLLRFLQIEVISKDQEIKLNSKSVKDENKQINRETVDVKEVVMMISQSNEKQMKDLPNRKVEKQETNLKYGKPTVQLPRGMLLKEGKLPDSSSLTAFDGEEKIDHNIREMSDTVGARVDKAKTKPSKFSCKKSQACSLCDFKTNSFHRLENHNKRRHNQESSETCERCGEEVRQSLMPNHQLYKHSKRNFPCEKCQKKYFRRCDLVNHIEGEHSDETFQCPHCNAQPFARKRRLEVHIKLHHEEHTVICAKCPFTTSENHYLVVHEKSKHTDKVDWPMCDQCDYRHWDKNQVKLHITKAHNGVRISCQLCAASFTQRGNMISHMKSLHQKQLVKTGVENTALPFSKRYKINSQI